MCIVDVVCEMVWFVGVVLCDVGVLYFIGGLMGFVFLLGVFVGVFLDV